MSWGNILYFLISAGAFALMMRFGCGSHVMGHGGQHTGTGDEGHRSGDEGHWKAPDQAVDPVCGVTVQPAAAKSTVHAGQVYYFCSQACRDKFEATPATYLKPAVGVVPPTQQTEHHHGAHC